MADTITWITATDYNGTTAVVAEAMTAEALHDWEQTAQQAGKLVTWRQPCASNRHWDGSRLSDREHLRILSDIAKAVAAPEAPYRLTGRWYKGGK